MTKHIFHRGLVAITLITLLAPETDATDQTLGPEKGTLVIVGGGDRDHRVFQQFVELAGGTDAKLVVIPTASSSKSDYDFSKNGAADFARTRLGMPNVTIVHTQDREQANSEDFVQPIREADAIWFSGGRQWRIADSYLGTLAEKEFRGVLERGGVIGGSSAGASIQGSFLVRGDTSGSDILIGDHQQGLAYITNSAIDQHVIPRKRQQGLVEVLTDPDKRMNPAIDRESLLGIGIDEATGIVVRKNEFEVIGKSDGVVLLYDPRSWKPDGAPYQTLHIGAKYNMQDRILIDSGKALPDQP